MSHSYWRLAPRRLFTQISRRRVGTGLVTPVFIRAEDYRWRSAILDQHGRHTYGQILDSSNTLSGKLVARFPGLLTNDKVTGPRIAFLCSNDVSYVVAKWCTWILGCIAVPLSPSHPQSEIEYFLHDCKPDVVLTTQEFSERITDVTRKLNIGHYELKTEDFVSDAVDDEKPVVVSPVKVGFRRTKAKGRNDDLLATNQYKRQAALIIYTSGTTGRPKGVVHTHGSLYANIDMMRLAWNMSSSDVLLHVLPLHHIHGVVNCLMTPMSVGGTCVMMPKFDAAKVWSSLLHPVSTDPLTRINLFMAVPTIYAKLLRYMDDKITNQGDRSWTKDFVRSTCMSRIRLMVSGSAALPEPVMLQWEELTGHRLLERYGMTETGMVLTNPLTGPRLPGTVGRPFPGIDVRLAKANVYSETGYDVISTGNSRSTSVAPGLEDESGELLVKGPNLFREYWANPEATKDTFTPDGWFKTGDTAVHHNNVYKILGRTSVDIIKSGGYKISALDVERHLLQHPDIQAVVVCGPPDLTWGQKVAAVAVLEPNSDLSLAQLRDWARQFMPPYQIPTVLKIIESMPYNAMGKVNKKEVMKLYFSKEMKNNVM